MKNTFKMTAIAAAIAALTACSDDDTDTVTGTSTYKNPNANVASAVFNSGSYTPITAEDRNGTWIISSRFADTYTNKNIESVATAQQLRNVAPPVETKTTEVKGRIDGGMLRMVTINENEGGFSLQSACGINNNQPYLLAPQEDGSFEFSDFNEDGSCDDNDTCESYNITFNGNAQAEIEHHKSTHDAGTEGDYSYESERTRTGGLTKISDGNSIQFNDDGLIVSEVDEGQVTSTSSIAASCFLYRAFGETATITETAADGTTEVSTEVLTSNRLVIEDMYSGTFTYNDEFSEEGVSFDNSQSLTSNIDEGNYSFAYDVEGDDEGETITNNDMITLDSISISAGMVSATGTAREGNSDNGLNFNFTIDTTDTDSQIK